LASRTASSVGMRKEARPIAVDSGADTTALEVVEMVDKTAAAEGGFVGRTVAVEGGVVGKTAAAEGGVVGKTAAAEGGFVGRTVAVEGGFVDGVACFDFAEWNFGYAVGPLDLPLRWQLVVIVACGRTF